MASASAKSIRAGDELHHFSWNTSASMLCPNAPHPHVKQRYLIRASF